MPENNSYSNIPKKNTIIQRVDQKNLENEYRIEARKVTSSIIQEIVGGTKEWKEIPVSSKEFFENYLNEPCFPEQQAFIDRAIGTDPYAWDITFQEAIAMIGKGAGKDRTIAKLLVYICYKLMCCRSPQKLFNQPEDDHIDIINISLNSKLAKKVFFKYFVAMIKKCRVPLKPGQREADRENWFIKNGLDFKRDVLDREVVFPGNIRCHSLDSTEYSFEGMNVFIVVFDEVGGFIPEKAREIYDAVTDTQVSRYGKYRKTVLISFPRDKNDFMMLRYHEAESEPGVYRVRASTWDWNIRRTKEDFKEKYLKNPEAAKRVYECIVDVSEGGYFKYKDQLEYAIKNCPRENPIVGNLVIIRSLKNIEFKPSFLPDSNLIYAVHVDTATAKDGCDAAGFCMGHLVPKMKSNLSQVHIKRLMEMDHNDISAFNNIEGMGVCIDLYFQIKAPTGGELMFNDVQDFIINLKRGLHFNIRRATFDGYQSLMLIQNLNNYGIESEQLSVDRTPIPYDTLKETIYRGMLDAYPNYVAHRELDELLITEKGKIDHPTESFRRSAEEGDKRGSKDVADAMCGVVHSCLIEIPKRFEVWFSSSGALPLQDQKDAIQTNEMMKLVRRGERR